MQRSALLSCEQAHRCMAFRKLCLKSNGLKASCSLVPLPAIRQAGSSYGTLKSHECRKVLMGSSVTDRPYTTIDIEPVQTSKQADAAERAQFELACPICQDTKFSVEAGKDSRQALNCPRCARTFNTDTSSSFVDLTLTSGVMQRVYKESLWGGVQIFRNPLVSFVYERGWRQGFAWAGFPGEAKEFDMAMDLLRPAYGQVLLDMSCGSGLFSRRFAASKQFSGVIAADFSETMLKQTQQTFDDSGFGNDGSVLLLRADVGRLPFATGSLAAVHAGAAIHCWPNPTAALAEISRVLRPGGVFVASTFLKAAAPLGQMFGDDLVRPLNMIDPTSAGTSNNYRWWEETELRELTETVGLIDFQRSRRLRFIMFSAQKPVAP